MWSELYHTRVRVSRVINLFSETRKTEQYSFVWGTCTPQTRWLSNRNEDSCKRSSQSFSCKSVVHNFYQAACSHFKSTALKPTAVWQNIGDTASKWQLTLNLVWPELTVRATGTKKSDAEKEAYALVVKHLQEMKLLTSTFKAQLVTRREQEKRRFSNFAPYPLKLSESIVQEIQEAVSSRANDANTLPNGYVGLTHQNGWHRKCVVDIIKGSPLQVYDDKTLQNRNEHLYIALNQRRQSIKYSLTKVQEQQRNLPIYNYREEILNTIDNNKVIVLSGETGCGKTTQVPQYILDNFIDQGKGSSCNIVITQPRRLSAVTIAKRVAFERDEKIGSNVGYKVRHDYVLPEGNGGTMLFCTTGTILQCLKNNPLLRGVSHVIIDEAHERDVFIDFLMTFLKDVANVNPDLHIIIMSASINEKKLSEYFDDCPIVHIPGFIHPITDCYLEDIDCILHRNTVDNETTTQESDTVKKVDIDLMCILTLWINSNRPPGAILCFLPGWHEIQSVKKALEEKCKFTNCEHKLAIHCVHSQVPYSEQSCIFNAVPKGVRKVILATNIAETSITINDVVYVIDSGFVKQTVYNPNWGTTTLARSWISKASAKQRRGRCGRTQPGECYHLYSQKLMDKLEPYPLPEIQRISLENIVLEAKIFCPHHKARDFLSLVPDPPSQAAIDEAVRDLYQRDFLTSEEELTFLGQVVTNFTIHPYLGKALVYSFWLRCLEPAQTIIAYLNADRTPFSGKLLQRSEIAKIKQQFELESNSDHVTLVNLFNKWLEAVEEDPKQLQQFSRDNMLNPVGMKYIYDTRMQLQKDAYKILRLFSDEAVQNFNMLSDEPTIVVAALNAGFAPNYLRGMLKFKNTLEKTSLSFLEVEGGSALIARDSVCSSSNLNHFWLTYFKSLRSDESGIAVIDDLSVVSPLSVLLFGGKRLYMREFNPNLPHHFLLENSDLFKDPVVLSVNEKPRLSFLCERQTGASVIQLHDLMKRDFEKFVYHLSHSTSSEEFLKECTQDRSLIDLVLKCLKDSVQEDFNMFLRFHSNLEKYYESWGSPKPHQLTG